MKFIIWIFGVIVGVLLWWGLTWIPTISNFNDMTHGKDVEQSTVHEQTPLRALVE